MIWASSLAVLELVTVREVVVSRCTCPHKSPQDSSDALRNRLEHLNMVWKLTMNLYLPKVLHRTLERKEAGWMSAVLVE